MNKSFNSFRALAFLGVFLFHTNKGAFPFGYLGVTAFFVLSGYLITPILIKTKDQTGSIYSYLKNFYGRRALRIFPIYYLYLVSVTALILIIGYKPSSYIGTIINDLPYTLTYTYNFYHLTRYFQHNQFISHFWSLAVEEQFYIFWPLFVYFLNEKYLNKALFGAILLGPFIRLFSFYIFENFPHHFIHSADTAVYVSTFSHIDAFLTGGFAAVYGKGKSIKTTHLYLFLAGIIFTGIIANALNTGHPDLRSLGYRDFMPDSGKFIWGYTLWNIFFALTLVRLNNRNFHPKLFENNILNFLGKVSYGLYIYHYPILYLVKNYVQLEGYVLKMFLALLLTVIVSWLSFIFYESKVLTLKDKLFPVQQ
jgi:peptidoglycan/LPS O-acetylase OafA/YrhL